MCTIVTYFNHIFLLIYKDKNHTLSNPYYKKIYKKNVFIYSGILINDIYFIIKINTNNHFLNTRIQIKWNI